MNCSIRNYFCEVISYPIPPVAADGSLCLSVFGGLLLASAVGCSGSPLPFERVFYATTTPEEMVALAEESGILIGADDFRALLTSGSTERWLLRGNASINPTLPCNGSLAFDNETSRR